jgi:hypothetical protein
MSIALHSQTGLRPRSGLGISSFALGTISTLSFMLLSGYVTVFRETASANAMIGVVMSLVWLINMIGIGLGIASVVRGSRNTLTILGLVLNFGILTLSVALIAIGLRMH